MDHYLTVGTSNLNEHLFWPIDEPIDATSFKPYGGLWLTKQVYEHYSDWIDYMTSHPHLLLYKYPNPTRLSAALVTLKSKAKIFNFSSKKDLDFLHEKYPHPTFAFSYKTLSKDYDGIYFDLYKLIRDHSFSPQEISSLLKLSVNSLVLFNLKCILYYQSALIHITQIDFEDSCEEVSYSIYIDEEHKKVSKDNPYDDFITALCTKTLLFLHEKNIDFASINTFELSKMIIDILRNQLASEMQEVMFRANIDETQIIRMLTRKVGELKLP